MTKGFGNGRIVAVLSLVGLLSAGAQAAQKKVIAGGWDFQCFTPQQMLEQADQFESTGLDGVVFALKVFRCKDGVVRNFVWYATHEPHISKDEFAAYVPAYRELVKKPGFRESLVATCWVPIGADRFAWTDDAAWARFAQNMAAFAWLAKEGGLKGMVADNEDYSKSYQYELLAGDPPYEQTAALARRRGREIGQAIFTEYPDITLYFFWLLSMDRTLAAAPDPLHAAQAKGNLWVPFVNGILDVMPPSAKLVDGDEHGYGYHTDRHDFELAAARHAITEMSLVAPENRKKFRSQVSFASGQYLDGILENASKRADGTTALQILADRLRAAAAVSDEYLWLWGEKNRWIKWKNLKTPYPQMKIAEERWEDRYPGLGDALREITHPNQYLLRRLSKARAAQAENLLVPALKRANGSWQTKKLQQGTFEYLPDQGKDGSVLMRATGVGLGCFELSVRGVKAGDRIAVEAYGKGPRSVFGSLRWRKDGKWFESMAYDVAALTGPADADGWHRIVAQGRAPEGADGFSLQLEVRLGPGETAEFDRAFGCRLDEIK